MSENQEIVVVKLDALGRETWRYSGRVLARNERGVLIEARFNRDDVPFHGVLMRRGDRFVEAYYLDRWYNVYEIHDRDSDAIKGWYCNVTRPAEMRDGMIFYADLALDLLVHPDGRQQVLDEDEFEALDVDALTREQALAALRALQALVKPQEGFTLRL